MASVWWCICGNTEYSPLVTGTGHCTLVPWCSILMLPEFCMDCMNRGRRKRKFRTKHKHHRTRWNKHGIATRCKSKVHLHSKLQRANPTHHWHRVWHRVWHRDPFSIQGLLRRDPGGLPHQSPGSGASGDGAGFSCRRASLLGWTSADFGWVPLHPQIPQRTTRLKKTARTYPIVLEEQE